jgi:hypothetical protein
MHRAAHDPANPDLPTARSAIARGRAATGVPACAADGGRGGRRMGRVARRCAPGGLPGTTLPVRLSRAVVWRTGVAWLGHNCQCPWRRAGCAAGLSSAAACRPPRLLRGAAPLAHTGCELSPTRAAAARGSCRCGCAQSTLVVFKRVATAAGELYAAIKSERC